MVIEIALMIFELVCPSISSPPEDWATVAACARVCRAWNTLVTPFLYRNVALDMSQNWQRLRSFAASTSPFKHTTKNLRITFKLQDLATQSDTIDFGTPSMTIIAFIHNCTRLKEILRQYKTLNSFELDLTALAPFDDDGHTPITAINMSNALQPNSMKSVMMACYSYFSDALLPLQTLIDIDNHRTPISLRIRHPIMGIAVQAILDERFLWQAMGGILQVLRPCYVTKMEIDIDSQCSFSWLWGFSRLNHLCLRQSHNSIFSDHTSDCARIADNLSVSLPYVNITSLSFCGMWSRIYPLALTTLSFEFLVWPNVDIYLFFSSLVTAKCLQNLNLHFRCFDFYDGVSPTDQELAALANRISIELKRLYDLTLFIDTDFHYELGKIGDPTNVELLGAEALDKEEELWKRLLGSMKSVRTVEIRDCRCSRRGLLDLVNNMEKLELVGSEKEMVWAAGKANQMGCEWRLKR